MNRNWTKADAAKLKQLDRLVLSGKATRKQVLAAFDLQRRRDLSRDYARLVLSTVAK